MSDTRRRYLLQSQPAALPATAGALRDFAAVHDAAGLHPLDPRRQRQVAALSAEELAWLQARQPGLQLEEDHPLDLLRMPGLPPMVDATADARELRLEVHGTAGEPVATARSTASAQGVAYRGNTDAQGQARAGPWARAPLEKLIVSPRHGYWSRTLVQPEQAAGQPRAAALHAAAPRARP